ncbi:hypothetical protein ACHAQA_002704 [Verticillium albo-atrum]
MSFEQLHVIALISGGKDSFFSILHCIKNGHKVVALANLHPAADQQANTEQNISSSGTRIISPDAPAPNNPSESDNGHVKSAPAADEEDLNSFMYQTVGHQVIPLYAAATGIPLYCQPILGGAKYEGRDYDAQHGVNDETESMVPLLRTIMTRHPEANALCAGAILSTYQRTRVESVALRLGLTPLAYLWKYPVLPPAVSGLPSDDAQLLLDMAAAGLDARIIKVASAGLDEDFLWERVSCATGVSKIKRGLRKFGAAEGSVLGEGGEFETLVVDGPKSLFRNRVVVPDQARRVVREGGGTSWLSFQGAYVAEKDPVQEESDKDVRVPELLDPRFDFVSTSISATEDLTTHEQSTSAEKKSSRGLPQADSTALQTEISWTVSSDGSTGFSDIGGETHHLVDNIKTLLAQSSLPTTAITNTVIVLRRMSDFPAINSIYGGLFNHPNPPSRITISSGDLLPDGCNITIHLTVQASLGPYDRKGLHVQSRSYWAPANIGPYSQATDVPLFGSSSSELSTTRSVSIAGQIPLWPASMLIPPEADISAQIAMSLQHLWRIAADQRVQLWSSAVAYFPRTPDADDMRRKARLAARAWEAAHVYATDEDEETGPDPWDRKYNPQFMTFGDAAGDSVPSLPDTDAMKVSLEDDDKPVVPPFFAAEVEELPRQSGVEWHAHLGLAGLPSSSAQYAGHVEAAAEGRPLTSRTSHLVVSGVPVRSAVSIEFQTDSGIAATSYDIVEAAKNAYSTSLTGGPAKEPYLVYIDTSRCGAAVPASGGRRNNDISSAIVPCHSLWSSAGTRLTAVALFSHFSR